MALTNTEYCRRYREKHREKYKEYTKKYRTEHKEYFSTYQKEHRERVSNHGGDVNRYQPYTVEEINIILSCEYSDVELAKKLNRSYSAIQKVRQRYRERES